MENNNSFTAIIVILAILILIGFYVITNSESLQIQTPALRKLFGLKKPSRSGKKDKDVSANPATQLMTNWYIQIADVSTGEEWTDPYEISMTSSQEEYTIGRDQNCDLCLPDNRVSSIHGAIRKDDDDNYVYENRSESNFTINLSTRKPVDEIPLEENLDLLIGNYQLRFHHTAFEPVLPPVEHIKETEETENKNKNESKDKTSSHRTSSKKEKPLDVLKVGKMSDSKKEPGKDVKTRIYENGE